MGSKIGPVKVFSSIGSIGVCSPARIRARIAARLGLFAANVVSSQLFFAQFSLPTRAKRLLRQWHWRAFPAPCTHWVEDLAAQPQSIKQTQTPPHHPSAQSIEPRMLHDRLENLELCPLAR